MCSVFLAANLEVYFGLESVYIFVFVGWLDCSDILPSENILDYGGIDR